MYTFLVIIIVFSGVSFFDGRRCVNPYLIYGYSFSKINKVELDERLIDQVIANNNW